MLNPNPPIGIHEWCEKNPNPTLEEAEAYMKELEDDILNFGTGESKGGLDKLVD